MNYDLSYGLQVKCVALKSSSDGRSDPAIRAGVQWLLQMVGRRYDEIAERVRADVEVQQAEEARERRERTERVHKIREERERWEEGGLEYECIGRREKCCMYKWRSKCS